MIVPLYFTATRVSWHTTVVAHVETAATHHCSLERIHLPATFVTPSAPHPEHPAARTHGAFGRIGAWLLGLLIVVLLAAPAGPDGAWAGSTTNAAPVDNAATDVTLPAVVESGGEANKSLMSPCPQGDCSDVGADCSPGCTASCSAACGIAVSPPGTDPLVPFSGRFTLPRGVSLAVPPATRRLRPPIA